MNRPLYALVLFIFGGLMFTSGYFTCKTQLGQMVSEAIEALDKSKVVMLKAEDYLKELENEIHDQLGAEDEEE